MNNIPLDQHEELFQNLAKICTDRTRIAINIPNPQYIAYSRIHHPECLQVIDQEVALFPLITHLEKCNLEIIFFEKYGIWEEGDYHFMVIRKKQVFVLKHLSDNRNIFAKVVKKVTNQFDRFKYK